MRSPTMLVDSGGHYIVMENFYAANSSWLYAHRIACRDRHHRDPDRLAIACRAAGS